VGGGVVGGGVVALVCAVLVVGGGLVVGFELVVVDVGRPAVEVADPSKLSAPTTTREMR
jgi:hypothetical protein